MKIRLRAIRYGCDFRKSEVTLHREFLKDSRFRDVKLGHGEALLFVSACENQLLWFFGRTDLKDKRLVIDSRRMRLVGGGTWSPVMLGDYARQVGFELVGIRLFHDAFRTRRGDAQLSLAAV